jgi:hypothetical protein
LDAGKFVTTTTLLGAIWPWTDNAHLHFEIRTFQDATAFSKNNQPFECGCVVGPGYWLVSRGGVSNPVADDPDVKWLDPFEVIEQSRRSLR